MVTRNVVAMRRDAKEFAHSHDANVHPDQVAEFEEDGWERVDPLDHDANGKKGGSRKKARAVENDPGAGELVDPLDEPREEIGGLTIRELHADCEANGVEIDPELTAGDLLEKVKAAKAAKTEA